MSTATLAAPPTVNASGEQAAEQVSYWRAQSNGNRRSLSLTVSVPFQRDEDDNQDVLPSRLVEQEVMDMLDDPPAR